MNKLFKALSLFSITIFFSCSSNLSEPIETRVLNILHGIPQMSDAEYASQFADIATIKKIIENPNYNIQTRDRKNLLKGIQEILVEAQYENKEEFLISRNSREDFIKSFTEYEIENSKEIQLVQDFKEDLDDGWMEREQYLSYGDKLFQLRIDYIAFEGKNYLLSIRRFRCERGCKPNKYQ